MSDSSQKKTGNALDFGLLGRLFSYTKPYKGQFGLALMLTISGALLTSLRPRMIEWAMDDFIIPGVLEGFVMFLGLFLLLIFSESVVGYFKTYLTAWLGQSVIRDMRNQVFKHILGLKLAYFDQTPVGQLQTRTISDIETLNDVFSSVFVRILGELLLLFAILGMMLFTNWKLTMVVLITVPMMLYATAVFKKHIKSAFQGVRNSVSNMNSFLQERITGMNIVHVFNREEIESDKYDDINQNLRKAHLKSVFAYSLFFPVMELVAAIALALVTWYGGGKIIQEELTVGELTGFIMYIGMFFRPLRMLADQFNTLQMGMVSAERVFKILDNSEKIDENASETVTEINQGSGVGIRFEKVWFAYQEEDWVLKNVSFEAEPGDTIALVGSTGSGKSTIINLLGRFYQIQKGDIYIDGVNIHDMPLEQLRKRIGVVLQDVFLFSGSIKDNISLNNASIPQSTIEEAAKRVGAHDFIMKLPGNYEYDVRERGATLSLGQRQLIAFARVLVYDPQILVLDEATANIDTESEAIIQAAVDTVLQGRTAIMIAHRLSTIQKADKIIVLDKGEIIEQGNHQELLQLGGSYHGLHAMQEV
ncbi:MAG: ABC transporter ATP-binding protein [Bacteroidia bacterium]